MDTNTLSFKLLASILSKKSYLISSVWISSLNTHKADHIQLIEIRSPRLQRTFLVHVPQKYKLVYDMDTYKTIKVSSATSCRVSEDQIDYINGIRGSILVCDLVSITNKIVYIYRNNGDILQHIIGDGEVEEQLKETDELSDLISSATQVIEKHGEKIVLPNLSEDIDDVEMPDTEKIIVPDASPEQIVELEFVDDLSEESESEEMEYTVDRSKALKTSLNYRKDNAIPPNISEIDSPRGIIYISISLPDLYKKMKGVDLPEETDLETEIVTMYDIMEENDKMIRIGKIENITIIVQDLVKKVNTELGLYNQKEETLKEHILSLSAILDKTETIKKSHTSGGGEVDKVYTQTRAAIYDVNIDLLKAKEGIDEYLDSIERTIEGFIEERL
jgi:hypothetical protein